MLDLRFQIALLCAKTLKFTISKTGGGATAAPGLLGLYIDPSILEKLSSGLETTILVTGTNGKTTTTRLIGDFLQNSNENIIHNRHGSNLERGLVSAFLDKTSLTGKPSSKIALFEVDEAALEGVAKKLSPTVLVITNLFRDQLDRYGEIDNIKRIWEKCISRLSQDTTIILNSDDPTLAYLGKKSRQKTVYFGIADKAQLKEERPLAVDSINCPNCHSELKYSGYFISHQGDYSCTNCDFSKPRADITAENIEILDNQSNFALNDSLKVTIELSIKLAGLYNIYNCLGAYSALKAIDRSLDTFPVVVANFKPVFGRAEKLSHQGKNINVALAKNPTGFGEIIKTYLKAEPKTVLILINDLIADGRDVSWLWDVNFEEIKDINHKYITSGIRGADMALRLKYSQIADYENITEVESALNKALELTKQNETLLIIPTYTAMLGLKKLFVKKNISGEFWED